MTSPRHIRLILNDRAAADPPLREMVARLREEGHEISVRQIWEAGDASLFSAEAVAAGADTVVAAGGDGTLNEAINGIFAASPTPRCGLGILPYGTANDFATACGIPTKDPEAAFRLILDTPPERVDLGVVAGRRFINVASGGYVAELTAEIAPETKRLLGAFSYFLTGLTNAPGIAAKETRLRAPDYDWEGSIFGIAVSNCKLAGGGFQVAPRAKLNDGLLDVLVIPDTPFKQLLRVIHDLRQLPNEAPETVTYFQTPWLEVTSPDGVQVNLDGEPLFEQRFHFESAPRALRIHLPEEAKSGLFLQDEAIDAQA